MPVYPRAVTASLRQQMKGIQLDNIEKQLQAIEKLKLPEKTMDIRKLNDATMIELEFAASSSNNENNTSSLVHEIDVLRGREMIKHHSGKYGSICYVIRRPG